MKAVNLRCGMLARLRQAQKASEMMRIYREERSTRWRLLPIVDQIPVFIAL